MKVEIINKVKFWKDYKFWLPLIISVVTFLATISISLNLNSPVTLRVFSYPHLIPNSLIDNKKYFKEGFNLGITYSLLNTGRKTGVIEDVFINVKGDDGFGWSSVHPMTQSDDRNVLLNCGVDGNKLGGSFTPFLVGGESAINKTYLFPLGNIKIGEYVVDTYIKVDGGFVKNSFLLKIDNSMMETYLNGDILFDVGINEKYGTKECGRTN